MNPNINLDSSWFTTTCMHELQSALYTFVIPNKYIVTYKCVDLYIRSEYYLYINCTCNTLDKKFTFVYFQYVYTIY